MPVGAFSLPSQPVIGHHSRNQVLRSRPIWGRLVADFHLSIMGLETLLIDRANAASGHSWIWWTIVPPTIGGLVAGVGLTYFAPAAAGSGIPQVKVAYTLRNGEVTVRETIGKFVLDRK